MCMYAQMKRCYVCVYSPARNFENGETQLERLLAARRSTRCTFDCDCTVITPLTPNGLPPHKLVLKIGAIVILIINLNLQYGLCNGTRLIIKQLLILSLRK